LKLSISCGKYGLSWSVRLKINDKNGSLSTVLTATHQKLQKL